MLLGVTERLEFVDAPGHVEDLKRYRACGYRMAGNRIAVVTDRDADLIEVHPSSRGSVDLGGVTIRALPAAAGDGVSRARGRRSPSPCRPRESRRHRAAIEKTGTSPDFPGSRLDAFLLCPGRWSSTAAPPVFDERAVCGLEAAKRMDEESRHCSAECRRAIRRGPGRGEAAMPARILSFSRRSTPSETSPTPSRVRHGCSGSGDVPVRAVPRPHASPRPLPGLCVDAGREPDQTVRSAGRCDSKKRE